MSAEHKIQLAEDKLKAKEFDQAVKLASDAIALDPKKPKPFIQKAIATQRLGNYQESFDASELAIANAHRLGKREVIAEAQVRRGIAAYYLKRYADADACFDWAKKYGSKDKSLELWADKATNKLDETESVVVEELPDVEPPKPATIVESERDEDMKEALELKQEYKQQAAVQKKQQEFYDKDTLRNGWFQNKDQVNASLFMKNAPKDDTSVEFGTTSAKVTTKQPDGTPFEYTLQFPQSINPETSEFRVFGTKIELTLVKAAVDVRWKSLEKVAGEEPAEQVSLDEMRTALNEPKLPNFHGNKNWDQVADSELEEWNKEEKDGGGGGGDGNEFFQQLFKDADEDTKRAMMKSFTESQGTALSTSWDDVKDKVYPVDPPTGLEAKKYPI